MIQIKNIVIITGVSIQSILYSGLTNILFETDEGSITIDTTKLLF